MITREALLTVLVRTRPCDHQYTRHQELFIKIGPRCARTSHAASPHLIAAEIVAPLIKHIVDNRLKRALRLRLNAALSRRQRSSLSPPRIPPGYAPFDIKHTKGRRGKFGCLKHTNFSPHFPLPFKGSNFAQNGRKSNSSCSKEFKVWLEEAYSCQSVASCLSPSSF